MPIVRKDHQWTTVQCEHCGDCHKVLKDKHMRALLCPYCGTTLMLSEGQTPLIQHRSLEEVNAILVEENTAEPAKKTFEKTMGDMLNIDVSEEN